MNKGKIALVALLFSFALLIPLANAAFTPGTVNRYIWVDKTQYRPGETITLYFTLYNARTSDVVINQVDIQAPWFMYIQDHWEGNLTIMVNKVLTAGEAYSNSTTIAVPNDGRATEFGSTAEIDVAIRTNIGNYFESIDVSIANPPINTSVHENDTIILLLAVLLILMVVCTALIAAAIFLSARRPTEAYTSQPPAPPMQI